MNSRERDLLGDIEEAEADVALYERVFKTLSSIATICLLAMTGGVVLGATSVGTGIDWGGTAAALIVPSSVIGTGSAAFLWFWFYMQNTREHTYRDPGLSRPWTGGPKRRLRQARRAHTDWVMSQGGAR